MEEILTYSQALDAMENGKAVALVGWDGFWFLANGVIYVFTKDGQLLNTPHEEYKSSEEWIVVNLTDEIKAAFIKANRVRIDTLMNTIKETQPCNRECQNAFSFLQAGFMWLGKVLQEIGAPNPYPKSTDPTSPVIEKHADKSGEEKIILMNRFFDLDRIAACKMLRKEVDISLDMLKWFGVLNGSRPLSLALTELENAKMWLGQQLNWIRIMDERAEAQRILHEEDVLSEAKSAYHRYGKVTDFKNFQGNPMPKFEELSETIQNAWKESVRYFMDRNSMGCCSHNPWDEFL